MRIAQQRWTASDGWQPPLPSGADATAQLVWVFGSPVALAEPRQLAAIRAAYPSAQLFGCSTAGEICGTQVTDDSLVTTAVAFTHTTLQHARVNIRDCQNSEQVGVRLAQTLAPHGLRHVVVLSDGQHVNGSELVRGLLSHLPPQVAVTGGLAGDGTRFQRTLVLADDGAQEDSVAVLGFYGSRLRVGYGSLGGWDSFGPERLITRSVGNILYELDGQPALELYKKYLGDHAAGLPASGLLFPLSLRSAHEANDVVRTILSIDEAAHSLTFAGDVPEGSYARLMKANFDRLVDGAHGAAHTSIAAFGATPVALAILISCVGRKLVLQQRTEEELEAVRDVVGARAFLTGFYSYGEICPAAPNANCQLHNQTMTITTFAEA